MELVGTAMIHAGRLPEAKEALSQVEGSSTNELLRLQAKYHLAQVSLQENDFPAAFVLFDKALADARSQSSDFFTVVCLGNLGATALVLRDPSAKKLLTEAVALSAKIGRADLALTSSLNLAQILLDDDDPEEAVSVLLALEPSLGESDPKEQFAIILGRAGLETARRNNFSLTVAAFEASERNYRAVGSKEADKVKTLLEHLSKFPQR